MNAILFFLISITLGINIPIKCAVTAPYNLNDPTTINSLYEVTRRGQARYPFNLAYLLENYLTLSTVKREEALDHFMDEFCEQKHFKSFEGITGDGRVFTNLSDVKELYREQASLPGAHVPFNVDAYNTIPYILEESQVGPNVAYVNTISMNSHVIRKQYLVPNQTDMLYVTGHYQNEFRINKKGKICISKFHDTYLTVNVISHTPELENPWDLPIF